MGFKKLLIFLFFLVSCVTNSKEQNSSKEESLRENHSLERSVGSPATFSQQDKSFMKEVIDLAHEEVKAHGLPFATIIVNSENKIVGKAVNHVSKSFDITDHAEISALRQVTMSLKKTNLKGYKVYIIGHPCSMCMSALIMAKPDKIFFAASLAEKDGALRNQKGRVDLYAELAKPFDERVVPMEQMVELRDSALDVYKLWDSYKE